MPVLRMRWARLTMMHWDWDPAEVQRTLPAGLTVDTRDGKAWIGLVAFYMQRTRPRGLPAMPGISSFLEANVRTYVFDSLGRPGVWFYSLDANKWLAVKLARAWYRLPYQHATMTAEAEGTDVMASYTVRRRGTKRTSKLAWRAHGTAAEAEPGTREFFFAERYRLFTHDAADGTLYTAKVWHPPYQLKPVEVTAWDDALPELAGFEIGKRAPVHACSTETVEVDAWPLTRVVSGETVTEPQEGLLGEQTMPA